MLGNFYSLRNKLLFVFSLFVFFIILIAASAFYSYVSTRNYSNLANQLDALVIQTLKMIKNQQDFFYYEAHNEYFFRTKKSKYLQEHEQLFQKIIQKIYDIEQIEAEINSTNSTIAKNIQIIQRDLQAYNQLFAECTKLLFKKGYKTFGTEGEMHAYMHEIEKKYANYIDKNLIYNIRRYEKDYTIRRENIYIEALENLCNQLQEQTQTTPFIPPKVKDKIILFLASYQRSFRSLVYYDQRLYHPQSGKIAIMRNKASIIEQTVLQLQQEVENQLRDIRNFFAFTFYATLVLTVLISIVLSYYVANAIAHPIKYLMQAIDTATQNDFQGIKPIFITYKDEIGHLTHKFNEMLAAIQQQMASIKQANERLAVQNTELTALNESLSQSEQAQKRINEVKNKLLSIISHDLRSPLNTMKGFLQTMVQFADAFTPAEIQKLSQETLYSLENILNLLNNLLQWSLSCTGELECKPRLINLAETANSVKDLYQQIAQNKNIQLQTTISEDLYVWADSNMLEFILRNLLSNAIKFSHNNSQVTILAHRANGLCYVQVKDQGVGIPKDALHKIFSKEQYYSTTGTAKEKGTGFGLLLCKDFIERNQGKMHIETEVGKGTTIQFSLPAREPITIEATTTT
ncbi:MAG: ATP-binding protein [Microscillaceae bacterium]|nr:ATP-binding protein [Microscillaceae bacterium]MDW8461222.1 ATP-binding protein [Cytophagales bacterium]